MYIPSDAELRVAIVEVDLNMGQRIIEVKMAMVVGDEEFRRNFPKFSDLPPDAQEVLKRWVETT